MARSAICLLIALLATSANARRRAVKVWPVIELDHLSTHERFLLQPDSRGILGSKQLRGLTRFLRCHHTGRAHTIAGRLPQLLYAVARHFGDRAISIVAGYRAPRIARQKGNPHSPHKAGRACDFKVDGVALPDLRDYLRQSFQRIGVGYYPNSGFVHLDVGRDKSAFWIDYSHPGERAQYSHDPLGDLANGRADQRPPPPVPTAFDEGDPGMAQD